MPRKPAASYRLTPFCISQSRMYAGGCAASHRSPIVLAWVNLWRLVSETESTICGFLFRSMDRASRSVKRRMSQYSVSELGLKLHAADNELKTSLYYWRKSKQTLAPEGNMTAKYKLRDDGPVADNNARARQCWPGREKL